MRRLILTIILAPWSHAAIACDCPLWPLSDRMRISDGVFLGEVVAHGIDSIELKIVESFKSTPKGSVPAKFTVPTGQSMCDYFLPGIGKPGERFLIFMTLREGKPTINRCFDSAPESAAFQDLKWLRSALTPVTVEELRSHLYSHLYYKTAQLSSMEECRGIYRVGENISGAGLEVRNKIDIRGIEAVEVAGDPIALPAATVAQTFLEGRLAVQPSSVKTMRTDDAVPVKIYLKDKSCVAMTFYPQTMPAQVATGAAWLSIPEVPQKCAMIARDIKPGMTRAELSRLAYADGGIASPFHQERYVLGDCADGSRVVKLNIAFKPAGTSSIAGPKDAILRVSPPYVEPLNYD